MLVLPTDWSPKNTSLYFAKADTAAIIRASHSKSKIGSNQELIFWRDREKLGLLTLNLSILPLSLPTINQETRDRDRKKEKLILDGKRI